MRRMILTAFLVAAAAAPAARANHSAPATYTGTIAGGGAVEFDVSADGTAVTRFKTLDVVRSPCAYSDTELIGPFAIANHAFQGGDPGFSFTGSFHATQQAQGTVSIAPPTTPSCTSGQLTWTATTAAPPALPPPAPAGPAPAADTTAPRSTVAATSPQRVDSRGRIAVRAGCPDEPCTATARGTLSVPGAAATFRLGPVTASVAQGKTARLALRLSSRARSAVRRALAKRRVVKARVTVTVADAAGNAGRTTRTIRLRG